MKNVPLGFCIMIDLGGWRMLLSQKSQGVGVSGHMESRVTWDNGNIHLAVSMQRGRFHRIYLNDLTHLFGGFWPIRFNFRCNWLKVWVFQWCWPLTKSNIPCYEPNRALQMNRPSHQVRMTRQNDRTLVVVYWLED